MKKDKPFITMACPLLISKILAGVAGFEPTNAGVKVPCLTAWRHPIANRKKMGWVMGIEPTTFRATI